MAQNQEAISPMPLATAILKSRAAMLKARRLSKFRSKKRESGWQQSCSCFSEPPDYNIDFIYNTMTPLEIKSYLDSNPPSETFDFTPWAKITDCEKFLQSTYNTLAN